MNKGDSLWHQTRFRSAGRQEGHKNIVIYSPQLSKFNLIVVMVVYRVQTKRVRRALRRVKQTTINERETGHHPGNDPHSKTKSLTWTKRHLYALNVIGQHQFTGNHINSKRDVFLLSDSPWRSRLSERTDVATKRVHQNVNLPILQPPDGIWETVAQYQTQIHSDKREARSRCVMQTKNCHTSITNGVRITNRPTSKKI